VGDSVSSWGSSLKSVDAFVWRHESSTQCTRECCLDQVNLDTRIASAFSACHSGSRANTRGKKGLTLAAPTAPLDPTLSRGFLASKCKNHQQFNAYTTPKRSNEIQLPRLHTEHVGTKTKRRMHPKEKSRQKSQVGNTSCEVTMHVEVCSCPVLLRNQAYCIKTIGGSPQ
jgi:hypothetical protein